MPLLVVRNLLVTRITVGNIHLDPLERLSTFITVAEMEELQEHLVTALDAGAIQYQTLEDANIPDDLEGATVEEIAGASSIAVEQAGVPIGSRGTLNFTAGATVTDDPVLERIDINVAGGGGGTAGHVERPFTFADYGASPVTVGLVPAGSVIYDVVLEITAPFNVATTLEVGDTLAVARYMTAGENDPTQVAPYSNYSGYTVPGLTTVLLTFGGPVPGAGTGKVTVYYS